MNTARQIYTLNFDNFDSAWEAKWAAKDAGMSVLLGPVGDQWKVVIDGYGKLPDWLQKLVTKEE